MTPSTKQEAERAVAFENWFGPQPADSTPQYAALVYWVQQAWDAAWQAALANSRATEGTASGVTVKVDRNRVWLVSGVQSFMLDYEADTEAELEWYARMLRGALAGKPAPNDGAEPTPSMSMFATMDDYKKAKAEHAKRAPTAPKDAP